MVECVGLELPGWKTTTFSWARQRMKRLHHHETEISGYRRTTQSQRTRCYLPCLTLWLETLSPPGRPGAGTAPGEPTTGGPPHRSVPGQQAPLEQDSSAPIPVIITCSGARFNCDFCPRRNLLATFFGLIWERERERSFSLFYLRRHTCLTFLKGPSPRVGTVHISQSPPCSCAHILWERHLDCG